jgi:hypothetical protein
MRRLVQCKSNASSFLLWRQGELRAFSDASVEFNATDLQRLTQRWIKCVDNEDFWKKIIKIL